MTSGRTSQKTLFLLECGHCQYGLRYQGYQVKCPACQKLRKIIDVFVHEWHVVCVDCTFGKWCGASEMIAVSEERSHWLKNPEHTIFHEWQTNPQAVKVWRKLSDAKIIPGERIPL